MLTMTNYKPMHCNLHVEDDPYCRCGFEIEDPYHFLFTFPLYAQIRVVMLDSISNIAPDSAPGLSLLQRGNINLTFDHNKAIFKYVQAFTRTSSRFEHDQQLCTSERIIGVNVSMCVAHNIFIYSLCVLFILSYTYMYAQYCIYSQAARQLYPAWKVKVFFSMDSISLGPI